MGENTKKYWFKRRRYGWGWVPITWQGWFTIVAFFITIIAAALQLPPKPEEPTSKDLAQFFGILIVGTLLLSIVTALKGPRPHWRWGKKPTDNPDEDY